MVTAAKETEEGKGGGAAVGKAAARRGSATSSTDGAVGASSQKCSKCQKRLARRNCPHQACVQCCADPSCEPHREARAVLKREKAILEGTDWVTRTAAHKRACKVTPGMFRDPAIRYFGETVVLWNVREFLRVPKWREDAMRRARQRKGGGGVAELSDAAGTGRRKRAREGGGEAPGGAAGRVDNEGTKSERPLSRKKRFRMVMDRGRGRFKMRNASRRWRCRVIGGWSCMFCCSRVETCRNERCALHVY
ncbi:hypothetical protein ACHAXT_008488 [Thalassiosira profunda]